MCVVEIFMMRKYYCRQHDHDELIIVWAIHVHIIWFICAYDHQPVIVFDHRETSRDIFSSRNGDDHGVLEGVG